MLLKEPSELTNFLLAKAAETSAAVGVLALLGGTRLLQNSTTTPRRIFKSLWVLFVVMLLSGLLQTLDVIFDEPSESSSLHRRVTSLQRKYYRIAQSAEKQGGASVFSIGITLVTGDASALDIVVRCFALASAIAFGAQLLIGSIRRPDISSNDEGKNKGKDAPSRGYPVWFQRLAAGGIVTTLLLNAFRCGGLVGFDVTQRP